VLASAWESAQLLTTPSFDSFSFHPGFRIANMTAEAIGRAPPGKDVTEPSAPKLGDLHQDVEVGPETVNIDRIEKVYA
jgi:hypothetical protein